MDTKSKHSSHNGLRKLEEKCYGRTAERHLDRIICNPQVLWRHKEDLGTVVQPPAGSGDVCSGNANRASISGSPGLRPDNKQKV